jgi:hypothetical protein
MKLTNLIWVILLFSTVFSLGCKKDCPNHKIEVDAGSTQQVQLPINSATLTGTVKSGTTTSDAYLWTFVSGPNAPQFSNSTSLSTTAGNLTAGTYIFQFQATNSYGETGIDTTSLVVLPVVSHTLVLQPANNTFEGDVNIHVPDTWIGGSPQFYIEAWTIFGDPYLGRVALKFDYSGLPSGAVIDNAKLYLYSDPNPINGDKVHAQSGTTNEFSIKGITSDWKMPNPFTWNNQPTTTTANQVTVPQSLTSDESIIADVTLLVADQQASVNNGFYMVLNNEVIYNVRQFASSFNADASIHPKLVIVYH